MQNQTVMEKINIVETLRAIEESIVSHQFRDKENSKIELKSLSNNGEWKSFHETVCAFLNTDGGYIICGIKEKNDKSGYLFTPFDRNNESKLFELHSSVFKDDLDHYPNLTDNITFDYIDFMTGSVALVKVLPLRSDLKFLSYKGKYYERKLTAVVHQFPRRYYQRHIFRVLQIIIRHINFIVERSINKRRHPTTLTFNFIKNLQHVG